MTKILVDKMPKDPEECPFVEHVFNNYKHRCRIGPVMGRCVLDLHIECEKLEAKEMSER